jgi:hypothetical protein
MSMSPVAMIIRELAIQLPVALVYLVGLVFALMYLSRAPRPAMAAAGGLAVLLLSLVVAPLITQVVLRSGVVEPMLALGVVGFLRSLVYAAAFAAILYAVFADRPAIPAGKPLV